MSDIVDLDALIPPDVIVHFGGEDITLKQPRVADVLRLGTIGDKLQKIDSLNDEQVDALVATMTTIVKSVAPQLADKDLSTNQLLKLVEIIGEMSTPPDVKEADERGITPDGPKVK